MRHYRSSSDMELFPGESLSCIHTGGPLRSASEPDDVPTAPDWDNSAASGQPAGRAGTGTVSPPDRPAPNSHHSSAHRPARRLMAAGKLQ